MGQNINRQLEMAKAYVTEAWLPVDAALISQLKSNIKGGKYKDSSELLKDLKKDFSLFMFCVRKLSEEARGKSNTDNLDPIELLKNASPELLASILDNHSSGISRHKLNQSTPDQAERMTHSIMSASVAEALSGSASVDPDLAWSCALFRELGLTLIAWNYPTVYKRVIKSIKPTQNLDESLSQMLGFTPSLLGISMARSWCLSPTVRLAMGDNTAANSLDEKSAKIAENLSSICQVGEALARASAPEVFPSAASDWKSASARIEEQLGKEGFAELRDTLNRNLATYLKAAPQIFKLPELLSTPQEPTADKTPSTPVPISFENRNRYVRFCPPELIPAFQELYEKLDSNRIQKETIDLLINKIILPLGFPRGCVFLVEPDAMMLSPRLNIGPVPAGTFSALNYSTISNQFNPVIAAFRSPVPILEENEPGEGSSPSFVAGSLGETKRAGCLYLELSSEMSNDPAANPVVYFKAVRQAMDDCLNLD